MTSSAENNKRTENVRHMINVMQMINDEGNGVYETWLMLGPPDGCTDSEIEEFVTDEEWYRDVCQLFAELISKLIATGGWNDDGYSTELYNTEAYRSWVNRRKENNQ